MKDPILDKPVSLGPQILLSVALFILVIGTLWSPLTLTLWLPLIWQPIAFDSDHVANSQDSNDRIIPRASLLARNHDHFLSLERCTKRKLYRLAFESWLPCTPAKGSPSTWPRQESPHPLKTRVW